MCVRRGEAVGPSPSHRSSANTRHTKDRLLEEIVQSFFFYSFISGIDNKTKLSVSIGGKLQSIKKKLILFHSRVSYIQPTSLMVGTISSAHTIMKEKYTYENAYMGKITIRARCVYIIIRSLSVSADN